MFYVLLLENKCFALPNRRSRGAELFVSGKEDIEKSLDKCILFQGLLQTIL